MYFNVDICFSGLLYSDFKENGDMFYIILILLFFFAKTWHLTS